jgi:hypothetical protein
MPFGNVLKLLLQEHWPTADNSNKSDVFTDYFAIAVDKHRVNLSPSAILFSYCILVTILFMHLLMMLSSLDHICLT